MAAGTTAEVQAWPVTALGQSYRRYRLVNEEAEMAMVQSLRRHGQVTPVVAFPGKRRSRSSTVSSAWRRPVRCPG